LNGFPLDRNPLITVPDPSLCPLAPEDVDSRGEPSTIAPEMRVTDEAEPPL